jgi:Cu(I)/Ag(I) efflux system membrane protein CusA/SilA
MEECLHLVFLLGATVAPSRSMAHHARSQNALLTAVGGENVSTVIKAEERCPVNVRYLRDYRSDLESLGRALAPVTGDKQISLSELSTIRTLTGPSMIRNEDGLLTEYFSST